MTKLRTISGFIAAALLATAAVTLNATPGAASGPRLECDAHGPGQTGFHARYEERVRSTSTRKKFNAEFEAVSGSTYSAGQRITFLVDNVAVGTKPLVLVAPGELAAELELDSAPSLHLPFPGNWPGIHSGSVVRAKLGTRILLGCQVQ
jgi:hypothetical protein